MTVLLDVALIPRLHVMGAAIASACAYWTTTAVLVALFRRTRRDPGESALVPAEPTLQVAS